MEKTHAAIIAMAVAAAAVTAAAQDPKSSLQQALIGQFSLTEVSADRGQIVTSGTAFVLQKDNLLLRVSSCPAPQVNSYKGGKISQPAFAGFGRDLVGSIGMAGNSTVANCPQRRVVHNEQLWVTKLTVQKDGVLLQVYYTPENDAAYYGELKIPFEKNSLPSAAQASAMIAEVLKPGQGTATVPAAQAVPAAALPGRKKGPRPVDTSEAAPAQAVVPRPPPAAPLRLPATYMNGQDQLQLNADNTLTLRESGETYRGSFVVTSDNNLELTVNETKTAITRQGDDLVDASNQRWTLQGLAAASGDGVLNNQDIVKMTSAQLSDDIVIARIRTSSCRFDTTPDALIELKQKGVSNAVIQAMLSGGK